MGLLNKVHQFICKYSMMSHDFIIRHEDNVKYLECIKCGDRIEGWRCGKLVRAIIGGN